MNFTRYLAALLMTMSLAGCCCGRNVIMDPCDPCGSMMQPCCPLAWLWPGTWFRGCGCGHGCGHGCGCGSSYYGDIIDGGCCGGGGHDYGYGGSGMMMDGMHSSGGCACGQTAPPMMSSPYSPAPMNSSPTIPIPSQAPTYSDPAPVPPTTGDQTTMIPSSPMNSASQPPQMQTISYEEFQRLPGTVISGPGSTTASAPTGVSNGIQRTSGVSQQFFPPPSPTAGSPRSFVNPSKVGQALWNPAKY